MEHDHQERLGFLYSRLNYEWQGMPEQPAALRLRRMRRLMRRLGDPHLGLKIIHVAGTKGKGSTAAMIASALSAAGIRAGLYTSPHLHRLEERYQIDGAPITPGEMDSLIDTVREAVEQLDLDRQDDGIRGATFFEITTAMALLHFANHHAGAVVLEVGMGGRLDSTNVVHPAISVITSISFDHTRQLGKTLPLIATQKAGILKRGRPAVSGVVDPESREAIRKIAATRRCHLRQIGVDFDFEAIPPAPPLTRPTPYSVRVKTWRRTHDDLRLPLLGPHQAHNAAVAVAALDALAEVEPDLAVTHAEIESGFAGLRLPARVEVMGQSPWLVIDGAHNAASAQSLADTLRHCFPPSHRTLIFGTTRDKDLPGQIRALAPAFEVLIATRYLENPRSVPIETLVEEFQDLAGRTPLTAADPGEALDLARRLTPGTGLICVTGSLFLATETRALLLPHMKTRATSDVT
jgi:dihydrofolate synthase/folylpolyglutamate synthase